jgi:NADH:ubiquinone oxidoreductase subunit 5 (subunit L)/multisubunit Na+/H+ antiporter MnhA subunit
MNRWSWLLVIFGCFALLLSLGDWKHIEVSPNEQPASAGEPVIIWVCLLLVGTASPTICCDG